MEDYDELVEKHKRESIMTEYNIPAYARCWLTIAKGCLGEHNAEAVDATKGGYLVRSRVSSRLDWTYWEIPKRKFRLNLRRSPKP